MLFYLCVALIVSIAFYFISNPTIDTFCPKKNDRYHYNEKLYKSQSGYVNRAAAQKTQINPLPANTIDFDHLYTINATDATNGTDGTDEDALIEIVRPKLSH